MSTILFIFTYVYLFYQVSAQDKGTGKEQKITITSDKGRLSNDEIERMVKEAEENAETDRILRERVEAKNSLESYLYHLQNTVKENLNDKISVEEKELANTTVTEGLKWLEEHVNDEKESFDEKRKEIEVIIGPIITKGYDTKASRKAPTDSSPNEPTVEEM